MHIFYMILCYNSFTIYSLYNFFFTFSGNGNYFNFSIHKTFFLACLKCKIFKTQIHFFLMSISETINENSFDSINDSPIDFENMSNGVLIFNTNLPDQNEIALAFAIDEGNNASSINED